MHQDDLAYLPAVKQIRLFRARDLSPVEVLQAQISRADDLADSVNALTWRFNDAALAAAREAEARYLGKGAAPRPLEGITLAIKEEMPVAGQPVTSASRAFADAVADHSSPLVERVIAAGAIIHARTTQPEFGCTVFTQSHLFGITRNPWNLAYDVGGSSGGAGAALAAGLTTLAAGSDIAGSIRIPAACCGVVGFKPPYGRVPQSPPFNLDHYCHDGPMARSVADCALFENVISGPAAIDIASLREQVTLPLNAPGVEGLRIAISADLGSWHPDDAARRNLQEVAQTLSAAGAIVEEVDLVIDREAVDHAATAHFGTIFGPSVAAITAEHRDLMTSYAIAFGEELTHPPAGAYLEGLELEGMITGTIGALLERYDALICPTLTMAALPVDTPWTLEPPGRGIASLPVDHLMTIPFNIASRCPVLNVPSGFDAHGVPTGVQLVGRTFDDETPFRLGAALERAGIWDYATIRPDEVSLNTRP
jgi:Asp-tRNA(Asn)/Glu-tRNA(Gln) amidotransferase A subunit family amidase